MSAEVAALILAAIKFAIACADEESELMQFAEDNRAVIDLLPDGTRAEARAAWRDRREQIRRYS